MSVPIVDLQSRRALPRAWPRRPGPGTGWARNSQESNRAALIPMRDDRSSVTADEEFLRAAEGTAVGSPSEWRCWFQALGLRET